MNRILLLAMGAVCAPGLVWLLLCGTVPVRLWCLLPLGLWAWVWPLAELRRASPVEFQPGLRALVQRTRAAAAAGAVPALVLAMASLPIAIHAGDLAHLRAGRLAVESLAAVPLALATMLLHLAFAEAIRSYRVPLRDVLLSLLTLDVAARVMLVPGRFDPVQEGLWLVAKGIGLHAWITTMDTRLARGLEPAGLRAVAADAIAAPGRLDREFVGRLRRLLRASLYSRYLPPLLSLFVLVVVWTFRGPGSGAAAAFGGTAVLCFIVVLLAAGELTAGLRKLVRRGVLSELLLTPTQPAEILAAVAQRTTGPLAVFLAAHVVALMAFSTAMQIDLNVEYAFWAYVAPPFIAFVAVAALMGPLMNLGLRASTAIGGIAGTLARLAALEVLVLALCIFCLIQGGMASLFDDLGFGGGRMRLDRVFDSLVASPGSAQVLVVCHLLLLLWIFVHWQRLLGDFRDLAHGNYERPDGRPFGGITPENH